MKQLAIVAAITIFTTSSMLANPVILEEVNRLESKIIALEAEVAARRAEIEQLKANPDFNQALKIKVGQMLLDTKTSVSKITEELMMKLRGEMKGEIVK